MSNLQLSEADLSDTLTRARAIAEQGQALALRAGDYEALVAAGEEMGIPRDAILQALRERHPVATEVITLGQLVFAPSMDGSWYPATVASLGDHTATVRFINGGEHTCAPGDLRSLTLVPGRKVQADWPTWGWCDVTVEKYDEKSGKVTLSDGWSKKSFELDKIRLSSRLATPPSPQERRLASLSRATLLRCSLLAGGAGMTLGALLMWLLRFL